MVSFGDSSMRFVVRPTSVMLRPFRPAAVTVEPEQRKQASLLSNGARRLCDGEGSDPPRARTENLLI